ncbi:S8 family peptidase [Pontibacter liquoris]|uniref:S8 family peptidase n=1 Tax=Pontibacter liquoris TaxID=2905677 RepID=UPI001FA7B455|nr:S8 family serine peptidase [Pontibacter liquoris]
MANMTFTPKLVYPLAFALAGMLFGCGQEQELAPDATMAEARAAAATADTGMPTITLRARNYIVIASGDALPAGIANKISAANGEVTSLMAEAGLAAVTSADPDFATKAAKISGVRSVIHDFDAHWLDPQARTLDLDETAVDLSAGAAYNTNRYFPLQWGATAIQAPAAWNTGAKGKGVRVAVLDSGFDLKHPDLAANIDVAASKSFVPTEALQFVAVPGKTFSHGTHTAGTIAAIDNNIGVVGIAPEAQLILVKVLRDAGSGSFSWMLQGIAYATQQGADVINMSLGAALPRNGRYLDDNGTPDDTSDDKIITDTKATQELIVAIGKMTTYASRHGVTVIASAGNDGNNGNTDQSLAHIPTGAPNVISISATGPTGWANDILNTNLDKLASYSNYGTSDIDFAAPGGDFVYPTNEIGTVAGVRQYVWALDMVLSLANGGSYTWSAGTSMAAPHAAGVAALIIGKNGGNMDPALVEAALRASADDLGKVGRDPYYGYGRINALKAVSKVK